MGKYFRVLIVIVVMLGLAILARSNAAWAASQTAGTNPSYLSQAEQSVPPDRDDGCGKDKDTKKDKDKCCGEGKDKESDKCCGRDKDKDKCDDDGGSVKPPDDDIDACERGEYSVGGVATLDVKKLRDRDCLRAHTRLPDPAMDQIPDSTGRILSDVLLLELPASGGRVKICFAVPPGRQVKIYSSGRGLKTTVRNGIACTEVSNSGIFMLVGK